MRVGHRAALPTEPETPSDGGEQDMFVPGDHTVAEVLAYVDEHPDQLEGIYAAEQAGKQRSTLLDGLEERRT